MLTLAQIKTAYQAAAVNKSTWAIRDYILYLIYENTYLSSSGGGGEEVVSSITASVSGNVTAGSVCISFETSEDFEGTINGIARSSSRFYTIRANYNSTLPAIAYTIVSGSINIDKQV